MTEDAIPDDLSGLNLYATARDVWAECIARGWTLAPYLLQRPSGGPAVKTVTIDTGTRSASESPELCKAVERFLPELFDLALAVQPGRYPS